MGTDPGPDPGVTSNHGSYWPNVQCSAGKWWTCALQTPSFQGCCEVNPCGGDGTGCPSSLLHPAAFKSTPLEDATVSTASSTAITMQPITKTSSSADLITSVTSLSTSMPGNASETTSRTSATASSTPKQVGGSVPEKSSSGLPIGAIAGGAGGGIVVLVIALLVFCWCRKRRQKKAPTHIDVQPGMMEYPGHSSSAMTKTNEGYQKSRNSGPLITTPVFHHLPKLMHLIRGLLQWPADIRRTGCCQVYLCTHNVTTLKSWPATISIWTNIAKSQLS